MRTVSVMAALILTLTACVPDIPGGARAIGIRDTVPERPTITVEIDSAYKEYDIVILI